MAALQTGAMPRALGHLETAVRLNPSRPDYAAQWARALSSAAMAREALEVARRALAQDPQDPMTLDTLGVVFTLGNAHEEAAQAFRGAVALQPGIASYRFNLGTSLSILGDMQGAEREHEACLALDPRYWKAHLALAQLRRQRAESNHVERLSGLLAQVGGDRNGRMYLNLALAGAVGEGSGLAGFCWTQLTDTLQEQNGLAWPDRTPKAPAAALRAAITTPPRPAED